jgi:HEAT repeat protein
MFCTSCWAELDDTATKCPECGHDLERDQRSYTDKLANALSHPIAATRARICWVIGRVQVKEFLPALESALYDPDAFVRLAAVQALAQFPVKPESIRERLGEMSSTDIILVRREATRLLQAMGDPVS